MNGHEKPEDGGGEAIRLYHTGKTEIREPDIRRGRKNADFGQGFYLTPDPEFAVRWAVPDAVVNEYELEEDGLAGTMSEQLDALQKAIEMDKETYLRLKKDEIVPLLEERIAARYHFQEAGIRVRLRYDEELKDAMTRPLVTL